MYTQRAQVFWAGLYAFCLDLEPKRHSSQLCLASSSRKNSCPFDTQLRGASKCNRSFEHVAISAVFLTTRPLNCLSLEPDIRATALYNFENEMRVQ